MNTKTQKTAEAALGLPQALITKSTEAENAFLGSLLLCEYVEPAPEREALIDDAIESLSEEDFLSAQARSIFRSIQKSFREHGSIAIPLLMAVIKEETRTVEGLDLAYLAKLQGAASSARECEPYSKIVKENSQRRKLLSLLNREISKASSDFSISTELLCTELENKIGDLGSSKGKTEDLVSLQQALANNLETVDELYHRENKGDASGLTTGFVELDQELSGLQPQDLIIVAGRPSMGKTGFSMNIARNLCGQTKLPGLIASLEMPADQLSMRMLGSESQINLQDLRRGNLSDGDWPRLTYGAQTLNEVPLYIDQSNSLTPSLLRRRALALTRKVGPLGIVVIDYIQLMSTGKGYASREQEIGEISRDLKKLARELNCPVVALSQLNRSLEKRPNKRPIMSDLRESGAIEQDADVILFIYRDEVYNDDTMDRGVAEIIIGKQRNGPIGTCRLAFDNRFVRFGDYYGPRNYED